MRDIPPALIQPANNQQVTETSSTSPVRSSPGCSPAGFSSSAKSTEPMGTHPLVSPNSSLLPLAIFAALILEKENSGTWWDRRGCGILVGPHVLWGRFYGGVVEHWTSWSKRWWVTNTENIQGRSWTGLWATCSSWRWQDDLKGSLPAQTTLWVHSVVNNNLGVLSSWAARPGNSSFPPLHLVRVKRCQVIPEYVIKAAFGLQNVYTSKAL